MKISKLNSQAQSFGRITVLTNPKVFRWNRFEHTTIYIDASNINRDKLVTFISGKEKTYMSSKAAKIAEKIRKLDGDSDPNKLAKIQKLLAKLFCYPPEAFQAIYLNKWLVGKNLIIIEPQNLIA